MESGFLLGIHVAGKVLTSIRRWGSEGVWTRCVFDGANIS